MDISVVIPLFNEEESLGELYERIGAALGPLGRGWEVIFIDDGSTDSSMDVLRDLHSQYDNVTVLVFGRNLGKSAALSVGFKEASGDVVFTMDADLQDDPAELPGMLELIESGHDLVSGWKKERKDPLSKRLPSKLYNAVTSRLSGVGIHDMNCGLKAYRATVIKTIKVYGELHRYTPVLAQWAGFTVTEIPVTHHARKFGRSKFGVERFMRGFFDLLTVLFLRRYVTRPLHLFGMLGALLFSGGFLAGLYLTVLKIMGEAIGRRPLLTLAILLMVVGVQFISFGLLGEMLANLRGDDVSYPVRERLERKDGELGTSLTGARLRTRPSQPMDTSGPENSRVAIIGPAYPLRGGNALFVAHLFDNLRLDHDAYVVSFTRLYPSLLFPGKTQMNVSHDPVKNTPSRQIIDSVNPLSWLEAVRWILRPKRRPDLVVFVWWNPFFGVCYGVMARMLRRRLGHRIVFVCENVVSHENRFVDRYLTRFALSAADYFMVLSGVVANRVHSLFPRTPVRQAALPIYDCYGPPEVDREAVRKSLGLARPTVLFFGYVREYKGLAYLLRAMPLILEEVDVDLLVVGEFYDDRAKYDRIIEERGIAERVRMVAEHVPDEDVGNYFSAADVAVLPYVSATQSGITQIALAFGLPVISTNVGGLPEVVREGETGYIVEPEDEQALARAVVRYFKGGEAERMRANAAVEAQRDHAGDLMRRAVLDFLEMARS